MKSGLRLLLAAALVSGGACAGTARADEGFHAGVDLLFLSPKFNDVNIGNVFYFPQPGTVNSVTGNSSSELDFAQRVIVGYEGDQGGGVQVRWFTFDNDVDYSGTIDHAIDGPITVSGLLNIDVDAIDAEITQRGEFRMWDWIATAGARYARVAIRENLVDDLEWELFSDTVWFGATGVEFEGAGPTVSVEGTRPIVWEELSIFGRARTALLYGDVDQFSAWRANGFLTIQDEFIQVWEIQIGTQLEVEYDNIDVLLGIFWEAQRWDSELLGDLAFHGFGVHTGIEY